MSNTPTPSRTASRSPSCRTRTGKFVAPDDKTFQAAAANADWKSAPGFGISLTNQPGDEAWPITAPTFILVHKNPEKPEQVAEVLKFFDWAYKNGDKLAVDLDYVPLPDKAEGSGPRDLDEARSRASSGQAGLHASKLRPSHGVATAKRIGEW